ncbi:MAG: integrase core domain-containing protein [Candidatus Odinarchaeota archaeon]
MAGLLENGIVERVVQNAKAEALRSFNNSTLEQVQQRMFRYRKFYNFHRKHAEISNKRPVELFNPYHHR